MCIRDRTTTLHVQHTFLYISLPSGRCTTTTWNLPTSPFVSQDKTTISFSELLYRPLDSIYSRKNRQHLTKWIGWIKNDEFWSSASSLFKWRFRRRSYHGCVNAVDVYCPFFFSQRGHLKCFCIKPSKKIILPLLFCFTRNTNGRCSLRLMVKKVSCF